MKNNQTAPVFEKTQEQIKAERIEKNLKAINDFMRGMEESRDEVLGEEFDLIMSERINITRELDL